MDSQDVSEAGGVAVPEGVVEGAPIAPVESVGCEPGSLKATLMEISQERIAEEKVVSLADLYAILLVLDGKLDKLLEIETGKAVSDRQPQLPPKGLV